MCQRESPLSPRRHAKVFAKKYERCFYSIPNIFSSFFTGLSASPVIFLKNPGISRLNISWPLAPMNDVKEELKLIKTLGLQHVPKTEFQICGMAQS